MPRTTLSDVDHYEQCFDILMLYKYISNRIEITMPVLLVQWYYNIVMNAFHDVRDRIPTYLKNRTYISKIYEGHRDILNSLITNLPSIFNVEHSRNYYIIWTNDKKAECIYVIQEVSSISIIGNNIVDYEYYYSKGFNSGYNLQIREPDLYITDIERKERAAWDRVDKDITRLTYDNFSIFRDAFRTGFYDGFYSESKHINLPTKGWSYYSE